MSSEQSTVCTICGALIWLEKTDLHTDWHRRVRMIYPPEGDVPEVAQTHE